MKPRPCLASMARMRAAAFARKSAKKHAGLVGGTDVHGQNAKHPMAAILAYRACASQLRVRRLEDSCCRR
jgi:hypothetical protein